MTAKIQEKGGLKALINARSYKYSEEESKNAQLRTESVRSGGSSLVAMMKPADFWNRDDPALVGGLDFSWFR